MCKKNRAAIFFAALAVSGGIARAELTPMAQSLTGTAPGPGGGQFFELYAPTINSSGLASFKADINVASNTGVFRSDGTNIVNIGDLSHIYVVCTVDETDIGSIEAGQAVDVKVDAYPNELFEGKVIRVDPQATVNQNVTTIAVKVEITDPDIRLKPTMDADCEFITAKPRKRVQGALRISHQRGFGQFDRETTRRHATIGQVL